MNVRFNLKTKKKESALIILKFRYQPGALPFVFSTRQKVPVQYWNTEANRVSKSRKFPQHRELNIFLDLLENEIFNIYRRAVNARQTVTNQLLKQKLLEYLQVKPIDARVTQQDFLNYYLTWIEARKGILAAGSMKHQMKCRNRVRLYCNETSQPTSMAQMSHTWWRGLIDHCCELKYHPNTIAKLISTLKSVLYDAIDEGCKVNQAFKSKKVTFKKIPPKTLSLNKVYLTRAEIQKVIDYDISKRPDLERTQDIAAIGLRTGLACTDFSKLTLENVTVENSVSVIDKNRQKTANKSLIPIHPDVARVLKKYNGFPPPYANQTLNKNLKELCKLAGITTPFIKTHYEGRSQRQEKYRKHQLVGTHTFRRSFISNLILEGLPDHAIMQMTGIRKKDTLETYNCLRAEESLSVGARADFFKESSLRVVA